MISKLKEILTTYADVTTLIAKHANDLEGLIMKVKEHNEKNGTKLKYKEESNDNKYRNQPQNWH